MPSLLPKVFLSFSSAALGGLALLALAAPGPAVAQAYRCGTGTTTYYSDRPCNSVGPAPTRIGGYGPQPPAVERRYTLPLPPQQRAPEYLKFMSADCASLQDGIRTAPARGLGAAAVAEVRDDYARRCRDDEAQARSRLALEQQRERSERSEREAAEAESARREQAQANQSTAQCGEMRRIIASRHQRIASMSAGEVGDLKRFEAAFAERCPGR